MRHLFIWTALSLLITCGSAHADQVNQRDAIPSPRLPPFESITPNHVSSNAASSSTGIYALGFGVPVHAEFYPFDAYIPCASGSPAAASSCRELQVTTDQKLTNIASTSLAGAVKRALLGNGGSHSSSVALIPLPSDINRALPISQQLISLPYMERHAALVAIALKQQVDVRYHGQVQNHDHSIFQNLAALGKGTRPGPMVFDGTANLSYSAQYWLYSVDTGQLLRSGVIGPVSAETPTFHASWYFEPAHISWGQTQWTVADLEAQGRIQDPRIQVIGETLKAMAPQVEMATKASLADWPQVVQAANELLVGQH